MNITRITPQLNNINKTYNNPSYKNISFAAAPIGEAKKAITPFKKYIAQPFIKHIFNPTVKGIEIFYTKMIKSKPFEKIITKMTESQEAKIKKNPNFESNLFAHLIVTGSTILSCFYVVKTINNKKLDEKRRRTLAINQGAVWLASTIMAYTVDGKLGKYTKKVQNDFKATALKQIENISSETDKNIKLASINRHYNGISNAKKIIAIDTIYRFIAPVVMTPIANYIGNKLQEKEEAELANNKK